MKKGKFMLIIFQFSIFCFSRMKLLLKKPFPEWSYSWKRFFGIPKRYSKSFYIRGGIPTSILIAILLSGLSSLISGCGYTTRSLITLDYQTIYVSPFVNKIDITSETSVARRYKTYYPLLENDITRKVINQFVLDGNLRLAKKEDADLVLEGELIDYRKDVLKYTGTGDEEVEEYRISLVVNLKLYDTSGQALLWGVNSFVGDTTYFVSRTSESSAISEAANDLARRVVDRVVDIW